ncbi:MAG: hypothetical protein ACK5AZ_07015 [Bryobacteraceae bacterium]
MQITRYLSLNESQLLGCTSAFVDSLFGALNQSAMYLRKLQGQKKGAAFAFEMQLDANRYGALLILDRWGEFTRAFAPHANLERHRSILDEAPERVRTAENLLGRVNDLIDAAESYSDEIVSACLMGFQALNTIFAEEKTAAEQALSLGPLLPEEFREYRRVFLGDLAAR